GVCYNKAVPIAMAALTGKEIIVPPEPGLMGAFGVALEIKHRLELGLLKEEEFSLDELIHRTVEYGRTFICAGGAEKCDRKCPISMITIDGKKYPFGGACNKYYNVQMNIKESDRGEDLIKLREKLVFEKYLCTPELNENAPTIGVSRSFLTNTLYPLYYNFFTRLGFKVILAQESKTTGVDKREAAFCYPVELSHGFLQDLLDKNPDYVFLPHIKEIYNPGEDNLPKKTCVLMQSENYYLKAAFKDELKSVRVLDPVLDFSDGYEAAEKEFLKMAQSLGKSKNEASKAYRFACAELSKMFSEFKKAGREVLASLEEDPEKFAVVTFGRSYNAFARDANLGVPQKFSSRGITVIPHDFLPYDDMESYKHMYWGLGQQILKGARFVYGHPQLFASYITNFSCGPDSFIIPYFRNIMGRKPSLTLELDSHSADAGVNTRIEAALDIIKSFRELNRNETFSEEKLNGFRPLEVLSETKIVDSDGRELRITDPSINVMVPNMGRLATEAFAAAFRHEGINSSPLPEYNMDTLTTGRGNTTCKECLPLILNAGSMIEYYNSRKNKDEKTLFFMAKGDGPCRLGQYHVYLEDIIKKRKMRNIGVYTLSDENSYEGLGNRFVLRGWAAITIGNLMTEVYNSIQALAVDRKNASAVFRHEYDKILDKLEHGTFDEFYRQLESSALILNRIERKESIHEAKKVVIVGEIFVRHEEFSRMDLLDRLIEKGFVVRIVPIGEYIYYSNYLAAKENAGSKTPAKDKLKFTIRDYAQKYVERRIRKILGKSGFIEFDMPEVKDVLKKAEHLVNPELAGEAILTIGSAMREIMDHVSGVISLGPFGCMPSRVAEAILNVEMNTMGKLIAEKRKVNTDENGDLPFLAIETDGNIFPQIIQSKIEIFMLQAERLHEKLKTADKTIADKYKDAFHRLINNISGNAGAGEPEEIPALISEAD
ncbi:MAG: acyl-CoA dehydratase activase-related protein, partial [Acidobacteriota bacterium]